MGASRPWKSWHPKDSSHRSTSTERRTSSSWSSGEVRVKHGETVIEAVAGSLVYGPRNVAHAFRVDSAEARLLLFFGPAGVEGFFREAGKPARSVGLPPADEQFIDREALMQIGNRYGQEYVGPPLPPKD
jgi:hypothetical protein